MRISQAPIYIPPVTEIDDTASNWITALVLCTPALLTVLLYALVM